MKLSVIIPVFESVRYIEACLASLYDQTLDGIQAVLVDDCGGDGTMAAAEAFMENHPDRLKYTVVRMPANGGPAAARNAGLKAAEGEYVAFLDADDRIEPGFCEKLYLAAVAAKADIACCDILVNDGVRTGIVRNPRFSGGAFTIALHRKYLREYVSYFTTYIYRRQFLLDNEIVFPDSRSAEDSCFLCCAILAARRIARVNEALYVYEKRPDSVSGRRSRSRAVQRLRSFKALRDWAYSHGMETYRPQLTLISLKKGLALAVRDLIIG